MQKHHHKILKGEDVPDFRVQALDGALVSKATLRGKNVFLSFLRNTGCPVCHLYVQEHIQNYHLLQAANVQVIFVYQSTAANLRKYLRGSSLPFTLIANPEDDLYKIFCVEKSWLKMMKGTFNGALTKVWKGWHAEWPGAPVDGDLSLICADFLIDENGKVLKAHYGKFFGDHLPIQELISALPISSL